jgi:hypothetical protein
MHYPPPPQMYILDLRSKVYNLEGWGVFITLKTKKSQKYKFQWWKCTFCSFRRFEVYGALEVPMGVPVQGLQTCILRSLEAEKWRFRVYRKSAKIDKNVLILVPEKWPFLDLFWTMVRNAKIVLFFWVPARPHGWGHFRVHFSQMWNCDGELINQGRQITTK